jgi:hypothetical protein
MIRSPSFRVPRLLMSVLVCAFAFGAFLLPLQVAQSEVVKLRTGESVKGRPLQELSDQRVLIIEDYLSGAVRRLSWDVVDPVDMDRLWTDWNWKTKALKPTKGHLVTIKLQGGATEDVRGLVVKETATHVHLMRGGRIVEIEKTKIEMPIEEEELDPRDIWTGEQLVQKYIEDEGISDPAALDSDGHWKLAEFAEQVGEYETARAHYEPCANDTEFLRQAVAKQRLARVEELLKNAAALDALRTIRQAIALKSFRRVREHLEGFATQFPDAGEEVTRRLEQARKLFETKRAETFQFEAKINFPKIVLRMIKEKVQEKEIGLSDVRSWTRRDLPDRAFEVLGEMLNKRDDVTAAEARGFWETRKKSGWRTATYGAGTFVVDKPKIKPPKRKRNNKKRNNRGGAAPSIEIPKAPTQDTWWARAGVKERVQWVMAFFVENSGLFEVSENYKYSVCTICNGVGLQTMNLSSGDQLSYICTRCAGAQRDKRVQYR